MADSYRDEGTLRETRWRNPHIEVEESCKGTYDGRAGATFIKMKESYEGRTAATIMKMEESLEGRAGTTLVEMKDIQGNL